MRFARSLRVVGAHAEGEVGNGIVGGFGQVPGQTMFDKRNYLAEQRDWLRQLILKSRVARLPGTPTSSCRATIHRPTPAT